MNQSLYIENLLKVFFGEDDSSIDNIMFIKHFNALSVDRSEIEKIVGEPVSDSVLFHTYRKNVIKAPYEPFLGAIRYYYDLYYKDKLSIEQFINSCNVYSLHRDLFISYLSKGKAVRKEMMIVEEIKFELRKMVTSIINCLNYIAAEHNVSIVLDKLEYVNMSTLRALEKILELSDSIKFRLLIVFNESEHISSSISEQYQKIINIAENSSIVFEWDVKEALNMKDIGNSFIPDTGKIFEYILKLNNLHFMLAIDDCDYYMDIIYGRIEEEKININTKSQFELYALKAMNYILMQNPKSALLMCEKMVLLYDCQTDPEMEFEYNYLCGLAQVQLIQSALAKRCAEKCAAIAERMDNDKMRFMSKVLMLTDEFSGWHSIFTVEFQKVHLDDDMVSLLKKNGYYNMLSYYYAYGGDNDEESMRKMVSGIPSKTLYEAITIAKRLGNTNFMLSCYTKYISLFTDKGFHKFVTKFYNEKLIIFNYENDYRRKANLWMGLGYNSIISEDYKKASDYFNRAIVLLYGLRDAEAIAEAIYNMSINYLCAMDYMSSCDMINTMLKILKNLGIETIQICNASKLYGIQALAYYRIGNEYRSYMSISKVKILLGHLLDKKDVPDYYRWHEDLFFYYFVNGLLEKSSGNYDLAERFFEHAKYHYETYPGSMFYSVVNFTIEYCDLLNKLGRKDEADSFAESSLQYCEANNYIQKKAAIMKGLNNIDIKVSPLPSPFTTVKVSQILELSYNVSKEQQLSERKKDIKFLSAWQEMLNRDDLEMEVIISNAATILQNSFNLDEVLLVMKSNEGIKELYKDNSMIIKGTYEQLFSFFEYSKKEFYINRTNKTFFDYDKILNVFDKESIVTVLGVPIIRDNQVLGVFIGLVKMHRNFTRNKILFNDDNLVIVKTAILQLAICIERLQNKKSIETINQKLNDIAITDMLTGLYNRQGFLKMIEQNENRKCQDTILYMDLDNFKYCNDNF